MWLVNDYILTCIFCFYLMLMLGHDGLRFHVTFQIFNARQLALKLISNVTYGYTAAGFSGRMPCAELADSIVQCGRRTLESAISFVNSHEKWNARVIYGDTDRYNLLYFKHPTILSWGAMGVIVVTTYIEFVCLRELL